MRAVYVNNLDNNSNANGNNNLNNNGRFLRITPALALFMNEDLYEKLCSYSNLELAFNKAKKRKTQRIDVLEFEEHLKDNLLQLQADLRFLAYSPKPLKTFVIRDPKTRTISKSDFRDRVVHHALCNIIGNLFEKSFIFDSYANQIGKGAFKAVERFEYYSRKVSRNYHKAAYALKADIKHYFDTVDHQILLQILEKQIIDKRIIWLIRKIITNHSSNNNITNNFNKSMPLGNLTSQFFANVYLNELDQFVKHQLKAKYYLRYVDDFVIVHHSKKVLGKWKNRIELFLNRKLALQLHPDKSKIISLERGVEFLGFVILPHYRLLKNRNLKKFKRKLKEIYSLYDNEEIGYDTIYDFMEGWLAYAKHADTYNLRKRIIAEFEQKFSSEISSKEVNRGLSKKNKKNK